MKRIIPILILAGIAPAVAAPLIGEKLIVSPASDSSNTVSDWSVAIGRYHNVNGVYSVAIGTGQNIAGTQSFATGCGNTVSSNYATALGFQNIVSGAQSTAIGYYNQVSGANSVAIGSWNVFSETNSLIVGGGSTINTGSGASNLYVGHSLMGGNNSDTIVTGSYNSSTSGYSSAIFGQGHTATSLNTGLMAGYSNVASGRQFVIGTGLIATDTTQAALIVGQYNCVTTPTPPAGSPKQIFVVGNGTGAGYPQNRKNALEVYTDGSVRLGKRGGDIAMGEFGNPGSGD